MLSDMACAISSGLFQGAMVGFWCRRRVDARKQGGGTPTTNEDASGACQPMAMAVAAATTASSVLRRRVE